MNLPFLGALILCCAYIALKYSAYRTKSQLRPTWKELWRFDFANDVNKRRNARAILWLAIFFFLIWGLYLITPESSSETAPKDDVALIKLIFLASAGFNLMARHIVYEEEVKDKESKAIPLLELIDTIKRTPWVMRGSDVISVAITATTLLMAASLIGLLHFAVFN